MVGFVLAKNAFFLNGAVHYWMQEELDLQIAPLTLWQYLKAFHKSNQQAKVRSVSQALTNHQLMTLGLEFICGLESKGIYGIRRKFISNMDMTFTSHRHISRNTLAARGR